MDLSTLDIGNDSPELSLRIISKIMQAGGGGASPPGATWDTVTLDPPDKPTSITYYNGGTAGSVISVISLTYDGDSVATVTKS